MYKNKKGITIIALIMTVIIMLILLGVGINVGEEGIKKAQLEDLKTEMLSIQAKAKIVIDKKAFQDEYNQEGMIALANNTNFNVKEELRSKLNNEDEYYIWDQTAMNNNGLNEITVNNDEFYIIDYTTGEIYYSLGWEGNYSLTEIQG